ncbi:MAG: hypothetical protein NTW57_01855 [Methylophilales bacterium]|nr:hypothetical protein [Methylophilales bacterium]
MKNVTLKFAVLATLGFVSAQVSAAGLVAIPAAGFGTTAYTNCYNTGRTVADPKQNFGSYSQATNTTTNNTCYATAANEASSPVAGYTLVAATTRYIPAVTGGTATATVNIGNVKDSVWRKPAATAPATPTDMCIFGTRVQLINADHDAGTAGTQLFEVNDVARGGYSASGTVNAGYFIQAANASVVYRIGRTFTSVQHRASTPTSGTNATGYLDLPGLGSTANISGVPTYNSPLLVPTVAEQSANVNSNWVDFTGDINFTDPDLSTNPVSAVTYIQAECNPVAPKTTAVSTWVKTGAIRLRQTAQESGATLKEIAIDGYAPPNAVAVP